MASKEPKKDAPKAFVTIKRKDDFNFELIEITPEGGNVLMTEIFPIVLGRAVEWLEKEAGVIT